VEKHRKLWKSTKTGAIAGVEENSEIEALAALKALPLL